MHAFVVHDRTEPFWPADARLFATDLAENRLRLNWDQASDVVGVTLYRIMQSGVEVALIRPPLRSVVLEGLTPFTAYDFGVIAEDAEGNQSAQTLSTTITTLDQTAPTWSANSALLVRATNGTSVTLGWSGAHDLGQLASYTLYQDNIEVGSVGSDTQIYGAGAIYIDRVPVSSRSNRRGGNRSDTGPSFRVSLNDARPPVWAVDATIAMLDTTPTTARITWSAATDDVGISGYEVSVDGQLPRPEPTFAPPHWILNSESCSDDIGGCPRWGR